MRVLGVKLEPLAKDRDDAWIGWHGRLCITVMPQGRQRGMRVEAGWHRAWVVWRTGRRSHRVTIEAWGRTDRNAATNLRRKVKALHADLGALLGGDA